MGEGAGKYSIFNPEEAHSFMLIIFHNKADSDNNGFIISPAYSNSSDCSCNVWYCQIPLPGRTLPSLPCIIATQTI